MAKAMQPQKMRFSQAIQTPMYKNLVNNTLGDPARGARFIANITSAVAVNPALQECNPGTILAGALLGESLLLQPSPQLGQFYLVPFKSKAKRDRQGNVIEPASVKAQFVLGYKGYIQLALRTGQYKRLNVLEVKAGELSGWDPFEERFHEMHFIHIASGFTEDGFITITPQGDGVTDEAGADGEVVISIPDDPRYEIKLVLQYGSKTNNWLLKQYNNNKQTPGNGLFNMQVKDLGSNPDFTASKAWVSKPAPCAYGKTGQSQEWTLRAVGKMEPKN